MKTASVSVIIPCFNCEDTIERAVESVWRQHYKPQELILIDDASTDSTDSKLFELKKHYGDRWIRLISLKQNSGPSVARNIGWNMAKGKYLAFLDADDAWHERKIEIQYSWMQAHPNVALTGHRCLWIDNRKLDFQLTGSIRGYRVQTYRLLFFNQFHTQSTMLLRNLPFRFDSKKRYSEDYLLWLEIVLSGYLAWFLDLPLGYYYKALYGENGLAGNLWEMEKGELNTYYSLCRDRLLSTFFIFFLTPYSMAKYFRRIFKSHKSLK